MTLVACSSAEPIRSLQTDNALSEPLKHSTRCSHSAV